MIDSHRKVLVAKFLVAGLLLLGANLAVMRAQGRLPTPVKSRGWVPDGPAILAMNNKLAHIVVPSIEFRQTTLADAIQYLRQESRRLDVTEPDPEARGVNIFLKLPAAASVGSAMPSTDARVTLTMNRIPLLEALKYVAAQAGLKVKIEAFAVSLVPLAESSDVLNTETFRVPPTFLPNTTGANGTSALDQPAAAAH